MATISVVIPSFNDADFLERALAALTAQTRVPDEVIVVDNASTDTTSLVARTAGALVVFEPIHGIWPAAAAGYDAARGDIIARLDADSVPPPDWVARIEAWFETSPPPDVLTGPGDFYGCRPIVTRFGETVFMGGYLRLMGLWLTQPPIFGSNFAMRRTVWLEVRGRVHRALPNVHDDLDLSLHLPPTLLVIWDGTLRVGISARPVATWSGFFRRMRWSARTLGLHLFDESPWQRRLALVTARRTARRTARTGQGGRGRVRAGSSR